MDLALQQLPLIFFTTLTPIGAGAFLPLFLLFLRSIYRKPSTNRIDQLTLIPILFAAVGFICSFFHLANPFNSLNVLRTVGQTPIANEVVAVSIFLILALVYWVFVMLKKWVAPEARMIMSGIVMVSGLVAVIFMGTAYLIPSVPTWDTPQTIIGLLGEWLFGGVALGMFLIALADPRDNNAYADELTAKIILGIGGLLLLGASVSTYIIGSSTNSAIIDISSNANSLLGAQSVLQFLIILAIVGAFFARKRFTRPVFGVVFTLALIACFLTRLCFYGMQIGIGL